MANEIVPYAMDKALREIYRVRALIEWRLTRDDIREIHSPILADIAELRSAVDSLEAAFHTEKDLPNGTGPTSKDSSKLS